MHDVARLRRVDVAAVPDVNADVSQAVEEQEVARLQGGERDAATHVVLRVRGVREADADMRVHPTGEAGAVETGAGRGAGPVVADAALLERDLDDPGGPFRDDGGACLPH